MNLAFGVLTVKLNSSSVITSSIAAAAQFQLQIDEVECEFKKKPNSLPNDEIAGFISLRLPLALVETHLI